MVVDSLQVGGAERQAVEVAVSLHRMGYAITVACSTGGPLAQPLLAEGVPVRSLMHRPVKRRLNAAYAWKLRALLRAGRFDLVHAHLYASSAAAGLATLGVSVPLVMTEHSEATWRGSRSRLTSRWMYGRADRVIAVSDGIWERLITEDGVSPERIAVIPNAVSPAEPTKRDAAVLPDAWRAGLLIGCLARLQPEKGVGVFLEAVPPILMNYPACHVLIVGDGPLRVELERRVRELGLEDRVHLLGFREDARAIIAQLDLLVLPSLSEGTPLVVLEAMAAGVPVVASEVGGIPEQIRHGQEGLLVPSGDPAALREACLALLYDPDRRRELGEAGRRRAASHFGHDAMVRRIEAVYDAVLGGDAPRPRGARRAGVRTR